MKKTSGKKVLKAKKVSKSTVKKKGQSLLNKAKKQLNTLKKQSSKTLKRAKNMAHVTEEEIVHYVKANPVKSVSTVALVALITGFISRLKK